MQIRKAGIADIEIIQLLAHRTWLVAYKDILSPEQMDYMLELIYSTNSLQQQINEKQHQFVLISDNELPVGFASFSMKDPATPAVYRLHKIYLDPSTQGKGAGKQLLQYVVEAARANGATDLELNVNRYNPSINFYKKMGFVIMKEEDVDIGNSYFMNDYVMSLPC